MTTQRRVDYTCEGRDLVGLLVLPDGDGPAPGILVAHEGPGQSDHEREVARRLAALGYVVFVLDYHDGGERIADRTEMFERLGVLMADTRLTVRSPRHHSPSFSPNLEWTRSGSRRSATASGGRCRSSSDVRALRWPRSSASTWDSPLIDPGRDNIGCPVLVCIGADDPIIPAEQRAAFEAEMRTGGVDWQMHVYGGVQHTFTNPAANGAGIPGIAYDEAADRRSWKAMLDLFAETLDAP